MMSTSMSEAAPVLARPGVAVRIYCTVDDTWGGETLVQAVTRALGAHGALDVVVLRAARGFGRGRHWHDVDAVDAGMNHPAVIEWIDTAEAFGRTWRDVAPLVDRHLVTVEPVALARSTAPSTPEARW